MLKICVSDETVKRFVKECMKDDECVLNTFEMEEKSVFQSKSCENEKNIIFFTVSEVEFEEFREILKECEKKYGLFESSRVSKFIDTLEEYKVVYTENNKKQSMRKLALQ